MKIIHVVAGITEEASGPSYSVVRLCEELIGIGHDVTLATLDWKPGFPYPPFVKPFPLGYGPRRLGRSPAMAKWLKVMASLNRVNIIHSHGSLWQMNSIYPAWATRRGIAKLVVSPYGSLTQWAMTHGSRLKKMFWPLLQRPAFKRVSCFHATAQSEYEDIRRLGFQKPVAIIPIGIDIPALSFKSKGSSGGRTLLFLGRTHPVKGLDILLSSWRIVQDLFPEWHLMIAGSDRGYYGVNGYLDKIKILAKDLGLKRVEFIGEAYGTKKLKIYQEADLFILPTYSENFGIAVAEALAAGTPAIVTKGAPWQVLPAIEAGWWIDIGIEPLVACLKDALALPPDRLMEMGLSGRRWVEVHLSWKSIATMTVETYQWILGDDYNKPNWVMIE